jgi:hypothetical protein
MRGHQHLFQIDLPYRDRREELFGPFSLYVVWNKYFFFFPWAAVGGVWECFGWVEISSMSGGQQVVDKRS